MSSMESGRSTPSGERMTSAFPSRLTTRGGTPGRRRAKGTDLLAAGVLRKSPAPGAGSVRPGGRLFPGRLRPRGNEPLPRARPGRAQHDHHRPGAARAARRCQLRARRGRRPEEDRGEGPYPREAGGVDVPCAPVRQTRGGAGGAARIRRGELQRVPEVPAEPPRRGEVPGRCARLPARRGAAYTRETLKSTIEELETANEELRSANEEYQSTNEELQSSNEELETSREELQSVNEELLTVNNENQGRIEELSVINDDMMNLINSSSIATIFLDNALQIKRYTPDATRIFNLIGTDVGRPLGHLTSNVRVEGLVEHAQAVLDSLIPFRAGRADPRRALVLDAAASVPHDAGRHRGRRGVVRRHQRLHFREARDARAPEGRQRVPGSPGVPRGNPRRRARFGDAGGEVNDAFRRLGTAPPREGERFYDAQGGAWDTVPGARAAGRRNAARGHGEGTDACRSSSLVWAPVGDDRRLSRCDDDGLSIAGSWRCGSSLRSP